ncbi:40S ribosomal protein S11-like [Triticum dicoccoides]|uniref:Small ribosomal subunit protein uS17 N-terminal domain-containing protein n=1 Tax=Triticum urartu TaxID=4572 RepID=A0A8R7QU63_TRIUA|nr:40S ribosomal protein S11-like [Triticum dicoccoides]XP_044403570.1 40S ribosomal protein S11-like [Triticum aestivum]
MAEQTEKAFLKQPKVFLCSKKTTKGNNKPGKEGSRFWKSVGLGFKTPKEAIEGTYIDKKCPFTGTVSVRGRIIAGTCHSAKMNRTIIVRRNYLHYVKKYQRYEKRHSNIPAHISPCFRVREGDHVIIGQCRPLSKTVRFNVLKVVPAGSKSGAVKKAFTGFYLKSSPNFKLRVSGLVKLCSECFVKIIDAVTWLPVNIHHSFFASCM